MPQGKRIYPVSGGGSSGKSTLIKRLKSLGFPVLEEIARQVLEERKKFPINNEEWHYRQVLIHERQYAQEEAAKENLIFSDRSLIDGYAYCTHILGYYPKEISNPDVRNRYTQTFILDRLPLKKDGTRIEKDEQEAEEIHQKIILVHKQMGYDPIFVPVFPGSLEESVSKRAQFILEKIGDLQND